MYNGIGLTTPRGSGTSGHVIKNLSYVKPDFFRNKLDSNSGKLRQQADQHNAALPLSTGNRDILDHNRKREVEVRLFEFQELLIEQGCTDTEIEEKLACKRIELTEVKSSSGSGRGRESLRNDTHSIASRKQSELALARNAFGIRDDFVSGAAFDPEIQERKKRERQDERARRTSEREQREHPASLGQASLAGHEKDRDRVEYNRRDRSRSR